MTARRRVSFVAVNRFSHPIRHATRIAAIIVVEPMCKPPTEIPTRHRQSTQQQSERSPKKSSQVRLVKRNSHCRKTSNVASMSVDYNVHGMFTRNTTESVIIHRLGHKLRRGGVDDSNHALPAENSLISNEHVPNSRLWKASVDTDRQGVA